MQQVTSLLPLALNQHSLPPLLPDADPSTNSEFFFTSPNCILPNPYAYPPARQVNQQVLKILASSWERRQDFFEVHQALKLILENAPAYFLLYTPDVGTDLELDPLLNNILKRYKWGLLHIINYAANDPKGVPAFKSMLQCLLEIRWLILQPGAQKVAILFYKALNAPIPVKEYIKFGDSEPDDHVMLSLEPILQVFFSLESLKLGPLTEYQCIQSMLRYPSLELYYALFYRGNLCKLMNFTTEQTLALHTSIYEMCLSKDCPIKIFETFTSLCEKEKKVAPLTPSWSERITQANLEELQQIAEEIKSAPSWILPKFALLALQRLKALEFSKDLHIAFLLLIPPDNLKVKFVDKLLPFLKECIDQYLLDECPQVGRLFARCLLKTTMHKNTFEYLLPEVMRWALKKGQICIYSDLRLRLTSPVPLELSLEYLRQLLKTQDHKEEIVDIAQELFSLNQLKGDIPWMELGKLLNSLQKLPWFEELLSTQILNELLGLLLSNLLDEPEVYAPLLPLFRTHFQLSCVKTLFLLSQDAVSKNQTENLALLISLFNAAESEFYPLQEWHAFLQQLSDSPLTDSFKDFLKLASKLLIGRLCASEEDENHKKALTLFLSLQKKNLRPLNQLEHFLEACKVIESAAESDLLNQCQPLLLEILQTDTSHLLTSEEDLDFYASVLLSLHPVHVSLKKCFSKTIQCVFNRLSFYSCMKEPLFNQFSNMLQLKHNQEYCFKKFNDLVQQGDYAQAIKLLNLFLNQFRDKRYPKLILRAISYSKSCSNIIFSKISDRQKNKQHILDLLKNLHKSILELSKILPNSILFRKNVPQAFLFELLAMLPEQKEEFYQWIYLKAIKFNSVNLLEQLCERVEKDKDLSPSYQITFLNWANEQSKKNQLNPGACIQMQQKAILSLAELSFSSLKKNPQHCFALLPVFDSFLDDKLILKSTLQIYSKELFGHLLHAIRNKIYPEKELGGYLYAFAKFLRKLTQRGKQAYPFLEEFIQSNSFGGTCSRFFTSHNTRPFFWYETIEELTKSVHQLLLNSVGETLQERTRRIELAYQLLSIALHSLLFTYMERNKFISRYRKGAFTLEHKAQIKKLLFPLTSLLITVLGHFPVCNPPQINLLVESFIPNADERHPHFNGRYFEMTLHECISAFTLASAFNLIKETFETVDKQTAIFLITPIYLRGLYICSGRDMDKKCRQGQNPDQIYMDLLIKVKEIGEWFISHSVHRPEQFSTFLKFTYRAKAELAVKRDLYNQPLPSFFKLTDPLIVTIFSLLSHEDLARIALACKKFRVLAAYKKS